ncbi:MAG: hypothetical protein GX456_16095 [Verrucomicrobia bacterium]|nr:hypothetical protein [Verrucomicrobiota bacterium]
MKALNTSLVIVLALFGGESFRAKSADTNRISIARDAGQFVIRWDGNGILEKSDSPLGIWQIVTGAVSPYRIEASGKAAFYRVHNLFTLTVTKLGNGSGSVRSAPDGIFCGENCSALFPGGAVVTLTATASSGSRFAGWGGDASGIDPCEITIDASKNVVATFDLAPPPVGLANGDFEDGPEVGWEQAPGQLIYPASALGIQAASGQYVAYLGPIGGSHSAQIGQMVALPAAWPLYLHFAVWIDSQETCEVGLWDTMGLYVNGQPVIENSRLCWSDSTEGWKWGSADISLWAGQTVGIVFALSSPQFDPLGSQVVLDAIYLDNQP